MDDQDDPRRYMQRQWKRNKPHLAPSDSLPTLRLCPTRPLFVCARCGFANAWIPLCLWCEWTSTEATRQFEARLPRPRRLSAPSRVVLASKQRPRRKTSASSAASSAPQKERASSSMHSDKRVPGITTALGAFHGDTVIPQTVGGDDREMASPPFVSHDGEREPPAKGGEHRVATATSITPPLSLPNVAKEREEHHEDQELKRNSRRHWRLLPPLFVRPPSRRFRSVATVERIQPSHALATQAMDSSTSVLMDTPRSTGSLEMSDGGPMHSTASFSSSQYSPVRGLRRTKNMTPLKRGSSVSVRSRSPLRGSVDIYPASAMEVRQSLTPSQDHDAPPVRLGHPSRPYYSAIRKDMSRPTSPVFSMTTPRTPSPISSQFEYVPRGTKSLDCDRTRFQYAPELRPMSMVLSGQAASPNMSSGFSLSGEMEMRMGLARWQRENAPGEPGGYHFREMRRSPMKDIKGRVRQIGRGLKELVLGR